MDQHIQVNRDYNIIVCIRCKRALTPGQGVVDHLRHTHRLAGTELKTIQEYLALGTASNPKTSPLPRNGGPRQPVIPVERGFQCRGCPFITTSEKNANLHWKSTGHTTPGPRYQTVHVQSWMDGRYARYWTVGHSGYDPGDGNTSERGSEEQPLSMLDMIVEASAKRVCEAHTQWRRAGQAIQGADYDNEFIKDMGWVEFAEGKDRAVIAKATCWVHSKDMDVNTADEPAEQGAQLVMLCESIIRVMQQCIPRIRAVPKAIRQRVHGIEEGKGSPTPFKMHAGENTLHKYGILLQRYICFCWRAFRMGQDKARDRLGMRLTDEQWGLLCDVHQALQEREDADDSGLGNSNSNSSDSSEGSIYSDPYDSDPYDDGAYNSDTNESPTAERQSIPPRSEHQAQSYELLDRALFRFMIASIKVKVGGALYTNALLCFFAAMAIRTGGGGFQPAGLFSGTVAAMLWVVRLFFLEDAFQDMPLDAEEIPVEKMEQFAAQHAAWLCVDRFTVVNTMINWMAYAKGHRNKTLATASVRWTDDNETLIHNGEHLRIHEFQRAACRLQLGVDRLANALFGSQWGTIGPNIDLQGIKDDTTFLGAGESFATNKANAWLRPGARLAIQASQSALFDARLNQWKRKGVAKWLSQLRRFKELLMVMGHVWLGMPGRGPEVTTMRHCDGLQVMRNVFLYNGHVMVVTDRDKAKAIRDMGRKVARFLPDAMGRVFVAYIAWLLPAEEVLEQALELPATPQANKEFMWRHGRSARWNTEKLSALLQREMGTAVGVRLGVARYRIMVIEMGRIVQGLQLAEMERRIEDENNEGFEVDELSGELLHVGGSWNIVWDLQSTHSTRTARQHYAVHIGMPGHLTPTLLRNFHEVSRLWHAFLNKGTPLQPWGRRGQTEQERGVEDTTVEAGDLEAESLAALQALEGEAATWRSAKQKECMHAILRLQGAQHLICVLPTGAGKSNLFMAPAVMAGRGTTVVVVPFSTLIDDLVGRAREKGVDAIQFRSSEVVRREAMPYVPRLVFVSADTAVAEDGLFIAYVDKLAHGGHLQRIFIDEAHVAITDSSYREALTKLKELHRFTRPMVMLTATLMKTMERDFRAMVLLPNAAIIRDQTTKTNARYEFTQVERKEGAVEKATVQFVRQAMASMASQEKCVVYCKSIADCRAIAEELGCLCHHSAMSETERKEAIALWLSGQASPVIAATTGLGTGVNFGGIVVIVHQGIPYGLVDYIQQTGRGARQDGQTVQCIVIHDGVRPFEAKGITSVSLRNQHAMWTVATAPGCVREQIAMIMDGVLGECCGDVDGAVPCCRCAPRYVAEAGRGWQDTRGEGAPVAVRDIDVGTDALARRADAEETRARGHAANVSVFQEDVRVRTVDERMARQWLEEVEDSCAACSIKSLLAEEGGLDRHNVDYHQDVGVHEALGAACPALDSGMVSHRVFRARLRFAAHSCCFTCKLPLDWCAQAKTDRGERDRCVYADKVLPVILVAASMTRQAAWIRDEFAIDLTDEAAFVQWLAGRQRFMDTRGTNMHVLWVRILRKAYGPRMRVAGL